MTQYVSYKPTQYIDRVYYGRILERERNFILLHWSYLLTNGEENWTNKLNTVGEYYPLRETNTYLTLQSSLCHSDSILVFFISKEDFLRKEPIL